MRRLTVPLIRQAPNQCGPASLWMVLSFFGKRVSVSTLARRARTTVMGTRAQDLARVARSYGFSASIKDRASLRDIRACLRTGIPPIVDWFSTDDGHYSVVVDCNRSQITLNDPEIRRRRTLALETFERVWFDFRGNVLRSPRQLELRRLIIVRPR